MMISNEQPKSALKKTINNVKVALDILALEHKSILTLLQIKESLSEEINKPHVAYQIIKIFVGIFASEYPCAIHYEIINEFIKSAPNENKENLNNIKQILTDLLVNKCNEFYLQVQAPIEHNLLFNNINEINKNFNTNEFGPLIEELDHNIDELLFIQDGMWIWDKQLFSYMHSKKIMTDKKLLQLIQASKKSVEDYLNNKIVNLSHWFQSIEKYYLSPTLIIITSLLWKYDLKPNSKFILHGRPSHITSHNQDILNIVSPKNYVKKDKLEVYSSEIIASPIIRPITNLNTAISLFESIPQIPTENLKKISKKERQIQLIQERISRGITKLSSVQNHKMNRFFTRHCFYKSTVGNKDIRLHLDSLGKDLATLIEGKEITHNELITDYLDLLYVYAFCYFETGKINGTLVHLTTYPSKKTGREDEAGTITPGIVFEFKNIKKVETKRKGEEFLIPIPNYPPLLRSNHHHAKLFMLQMIFMGEFSRQSRELYENESINISKPFIDSSLARCDIPHKRYNRKEKKYDLLWDEIEKIWINGDHLGTPPFLKKIKDGYYTLFDKQDLNFLLIQGKERSEASHKGKISNEKKQKLIKSK